MKRPFIIQDFSNYFFILHKYELVYLFLRPLLALFPGLLNEVWLVPQALPH